MTSRATSSGATFRIGEPMHLLLARHDGAMPVLALSSGSPTRRHVGNASARSGQNDNPRSSSASSPLETGPSVAFDRRCDARRLVRLEAINERAAAVFRHDITKATHRLAGNAHLDINAAARIVRAAVAPKPVCVGPGSPARPDRPASPRPAHPARSARVGR
jgi:hypothetical protein